MGLLASTDLDEAYARRKLGDRLARGLASAAVAVAVLPLVAIAAYVLWYGVRAFTPSFFLASVGTHGNGMANAIAGTIELVLLASAMAIPLGVASGLYLAETRTTRLSRTIRFGADVLAGVPSILIGVVVYAVVVVRMKHFSAFAGASALAIVMLPLVTRTTDIVARAVPDSLREAALALGASRWRTALLVVLREAAPGVRSGCMLAVARACGETAPLLFTAFNNRFFAGSVLEPTSTLQVQIFTYTLTPNEDWHAQAWAAALCLVAIVVILNVIARRLLRSVRPA